MTTSATFRVYGENKEYSLLKLSQKLAELHENGYSVTVPFINSWKSGEWLIAYDENKELGQCPSAVAHLIVLSDNDGNITEEEAYCLRCRNDFSELIEF